MRLALFIEALICLAATPAWAALDLDRVAVTRLDNGLTLLVLEEHSRPIVSVQMLYKVGGRDDPAGRMGLAHFFEHMAFRSSKNFPGTRLVDDIYDAGGEWHGYTWIDQTTYFATAPKDDLDLLLRIEADRMGRLRIAENDVQAEFGAVLAEMNQYENDPSSVLFDALLAAAFPVHPYGKNTIGYEGDIAAITKADLDAFYERHIGPASGVLAVVGDVDRDEVARRVKKLFGKFKRNADPSMPATGAPARAAVRRIRMTGASEGKLFKIAYPAPAANDPDFATFLILQTLAGANEGANFLQSDWGAPVDAKSPLAAVGNDIRLWFIPTAQPYVFLISGNVRADADEAKIEAGVHRALVALSATPSKASLEAARGAVKRELLLDIMTTEDAAHQLAYFEGIGALDNLLTLSVKIDAVTAEEVAAAAHRWLDPDRRTIGWLIPEAQTSERTPLGAAPRALRLAEPRAGAAATPSAADSPSILKLKNSTPVLVQPSSLSPTVTVKVTVGGLYDCGLCAQHKPAPGYTSLALTAPSQELAATIDRLKDALASAKPSRVEPPSSTDPAERLEEILDSHFQTRRAPEQAAPLVIAVAGDLKPEPALALLEAAFGGAHSASPAAVTLRTPASVSLSMAEEKSQAALGYMVSAPPIRGPDFLAWRLALHIFTHDYGGRLGAEAISRQGLVYYIGSDYRSGTGQGLITLSIGVDPDKQVAMASLLKTELTRLIAEPPTEDELSRAKRHLIGRRISAAQSNPEIADFLADEWIAWGHALSDEAYIEAVNVVTLEQVRAVLPRFTKGDIVTIRVGVKDQTNE